MTHPYKPDYCIAPAATLTAWMEENGLSINDAAARWTGGWPQTRARSVIHDVLDREPLNAGHAEILESITGIPKQFWLAHEHNYRAGLAAGLKDAT
jgi:hypothetical protein